MAAQNHLQGDDAAQIFLACLVHDAHAAAAKLLEQLEFAEIASGPFVAGRRPPRKTQRALGIGFHRRRQAFQRFQAFQSAGQFRMGGEKVLFAGPLPGMDFVKVGVEHGESGFVVGIGHVWAPSTCCSFWMARVHSICVAGRVRFIL